GDGDETAVPGDGDETAVPGDGDETAVPGDGDETKPDSKEKLPDTATTTYNSLMVGTLLLLIGLILLFISRKKLLQ
ncbi:MAG: LPXTG cell wall anchor domain-containing protein, partial [Anaerobacillus sp.]|uniref:LPXTG cell wall anchor domain-containing protein n=1 Tax=Anaerobacillus sp. TaxID=1872506 RepID=UPI00391ABA81